MKKHRLRKMGRHRRTLNEPIRLQSMGHLVDWDVFTPVLDEIFGPPQASVNVYRSWDYLVIFRSILLGEMNGLSNKHLEFMLLDSISFKKFVGLETLDQVPDHKTLFKYRFMLKQSDRLDELIEVFKKQLLTKGFEVQ